MLKHIIIAICLFTGLTQNVDPNTTETTDTTQEISANTELSTTTLSLEDYKNTIINESDLYNSLDYGEVFSAMKASVDSGEIINLGDAIKMTSNLTIPDNFMYDLSECGLTGTLDTTTLNFEYATLLNNMNNSSNDVSNLISSSSNMGTVDLFKNTYGDLASQCALQQIDLPPEFSLQNLTASNNSAINSMYSSAYASRDFQDIRNSINISGIMNQAKSGLSMPTLQSTSNLQSRLGTYSASAKKNYETNQKNDAIEINNLAKSAAASQLSTRSLVDNTNLMTATYDTSSGTYKLTPSSLENTTVFSDNLNNMSNKADALAEKLQNTSIGNVSLSGLSVIPSTISNVLNNASNYASKFENVVHDEYKSNNYINHLADTDPSNVHNELRFNQWYKDVFHEAQPK